MAFDSAGTLYEAVEANPAVDNIHKFSPLGVDLGNFATFPAVDGPMFLAFEPSPVSEPSSLTLLAMGLSVLVGSF
ncbi:MAG: hypothetical protein JO282_07010 [Alphaproteobacteria bacterium]|nr:hypothetical protein [Alphaproteobacteria bacterium]